MKDGLLYFVLVFFLLWRRLTVTFSCNFLLPVVFWHGSSNVLKGEKGRKFMSHYMCVEKSTR